MTSPCVCCWLWAPLCSWRQVNAPLVLAGPAAAAAYAAWPGPSAWPCYEFQAAVRGLSSRRRRSGPGSAQSRRAVNLCSFRTESSSIFSTLSTGSTIDVSVLKFLLNKVILKKNCIVCPAALCCRDRGQRQSERRRGRYSQPQQEDEAQRRSLPSSPWLWARASCLSVGVVVLVWLGVLVAPGSLGL